MIFFEFAPKMEGSKNGDDGGAEGDSDDSGAEGDSDDGGGDDDHNDDGGEADCGKGSIKKWKFK